VQIVICSLLTLSLIFIFDIIYYLKKEKSPIPKEKRKKKLSRILVIIAIISGCSLYFLINSSNNRMSTTILMFTLASSILLSVSTIYLVIISNQIRPLFLESLYLFLYCLSMLLKLNHFPGSSVILLLSTVLLLCFYISSVSINFESEKKLNKSSAWFLLIAFLIIILNLTGTLFKTMHWPGGNMMGYLATFLLLFIGVSLVFRKQFTYPNGKISLLKLMGKIKGNFSLILIFYTIATIYFALSIFNLGPKFYSNSKPAAMEKLWDNAKVEIAIPKYFIYFEAYNKFLDHRSESEEKEINKVNK